MADTAMMMPAAVKKALTSFGQQLRCPICLESVTVPYSLPCNHCFCEPCIGVALTYAPKCPVCKAAAKKRHLRLDESIQRIQNALQVLLAHPDVKADDEDVSVATHVTTTLRPDTTRANTSDPIRRSQHQTGEPPRVEAPRSKPPTPPPVAPLRLQPTPIRGALPRYKAPVLQRRLSQKENVPANISALPSTSSNPASPVTNQVAPTKPQQHEASSPTAKPSMYSRTYSDSIVPCTQESHPSVVDLTSSIDTTTPPPKNRPKNAAASPPAAAHGSSDHQLATFKPGDVVQVMARTWPGINKLGGTAWISTCNSEDNTYNVRYVLGGRETNVHAQYISMFQDMAEEATPVRATKRRTSSPHAPSSPFSSPASDDETDAPSYPHRAPLRKKAKKPAADERVVAVEKPVRRVSDEPMVLLCSGLSHEEKLAVEECAVRVLHATIAQDWTPQVTHIIVQCQHLAASKIKLMMPPSPSVPAAITSTKPIKRWVKIRSLKFLKALVSGRWIVGPAWIKDCLQQRTHVDEDAYEVHGLMKAHHVLDVAKKARLLRETHLAKRGIESASSVGTGLFSSFICYVHGQFASPLPPKAEISALIRLGGGKVSTAWTEVESMAAKDPSLPIVVVMEQAADAASFVHPAASSVAASAAISCVGYDWVLDCISECNIKSFV